MDGGTEEFHSFLITTTGLNTTPVISNVGPISGVPSFHYLISGQTKFSPDGKKIAIAFGYSDTTVVLDFDATNRNC